MNKADIVQRLLDAGQITAQEAVILLKEEPIQYYAPFHAPDNPTTIDPPMWYGVRPDMWYTTATNPDN